MKKDISIGEFNYTVYSDGNISNSFKMFKAPKEGSYKYFFVKTNGKIKKIYLHRLKDSLVGLE